MADTTIVMIDSHRVITDMTITDMTVTHDHDRRDTDRQWTDRQWTDTRSTVTRHSHVICSCLDRVITHRHINDIRINNIETTSTSMTFDNIVTSTTSNRIQRRESSKAKNRGHIVDGHPHKTPPKTPHRDTPTDDTPTDGTPNGRRGCGCHIIALHHRIVLGEAHLSKGDLPPTPKGIGRLG